MSEWRSSGAQLTFRQRTQAYLNPWIHIQICFSCHRLEPVVEQDDPLQAEIWNRCVTKTEFLFNWRLHLWNEIYWDWDIFGCTIHFLMFSASDWSSGSTQHSVHSRMIFPVSLRNKHEKTSVENINKLNMYSKHFYYYSYWRPIYWW